MGDHEQEHERKGEPSMDNNRLGGVRQEKHRAHHERHSMGCELGDKVKRIVDHAQRLKHDGLVHGEHRADCKEEYDVSLMDEQSVNHTCGNHARNRVQICDLPAYRVQESANLYPDSRKPGFTNPRPGYVCN